MSYDAKYKKGEKKKVKKLLRKYHGSKKSFLKGVKQLVKAP